MRSAAPSKLPYNRALAQRSPIVKSTAKTGTIAKPKARRNSSTPLKRAQFLAITKAVSDPTRYEILQHIARRENCSCAHLRECSPITAATLSHHLKELADAGLIRISRRGKFAYPSFRREVWKIYLDELGEL